MLRSLSRVWHRIGSTKAALLVIVLTITACAEPGITDPRREPTARDAELVVSANVIGTSITTLVVRVSAEDIPLSLIFNILRNDDGMAFGLIRVPPGLARFVEVQAFDESGEITHEGSAVVNVQPGNNPPLIIVLVPRTGQVPIVISMAEFSIFVSPNFHHLPDVGGSVQMNATLLTNDGSGMVDISGTAEWASSNPAIATVDGNGMVTGHAAGSAAIAATYQGVVGYATVNVGTSDSPFQGLYTGTATVTNEFGEVAIFDVFGLNACTLETSPCGADLFVTSEGPASLTYLLTLNGSIFLSETQPDTQDAVFVAQLLPLLDDGLQQTQCEVSMVLFLGDSDGDAVQDAAGEAAIGCYDLNSGVTLATRNYSVFVEK